MSHRGDGHAWKCPYCSKWSFGKIRCGHCFSRVRDMEWIEREEKHEKEVDNEDTGE